jgi:hypothetical protein
MWAAWVIAAIALAATAFMVSFLIALLRESATSVCYRVLPVRRGPEKERNPKVLRVICFDDARHVTESDHGDYRLELMESECHVEEKCISGPIARAVYHFPDNVVWRSVQPSRGNIFRGRRL